MPCIAFAVVAPNQPANNKSVKILTFTRLDFFKFMGYSNDETRCKVRRYLHAKCPPRKSLPEIGAYEIDKQMDSLSDFYLKKSLADLKTATVGLHDRGSLVPFV